MSVGRDTMREAGLAAVGVVVFIVFLFAAGLLAPGVMSKVGAYVIVAGIVAFIVVMAAIGVVFFGE